jgi:GlpG protein
MRIVYTLKEQKKARQLSTFLATEGIENQLEIETISDWGSADYGDILCKLWIYDEDQVSVAMRWIKKFEENPNDPLFASVPGASAPPPPAPFPTLHLPKQLHTSEMLAHPLKRGEKSVEKFMGVCTTAIVLLCTCLLLIMEASTPPIPITYPSYLPAIALFSPPVEKALMYDYPKNYALADRLNTLYGLERLQTPQELPSEGKYLLQEFHKTPAWEGIYPSLVASLQKKRLEIVQKAPLFEKIDQGQAWRLFTPCLLHSGFLHLLFNMLWLILLGKQLEERLRAPRYLLLVLAAGVFTNTCQYLMGGPNFVGFSGVLCALLTFIWMRQKKAPWEGYPLQRATVTFLMVFICAMFALQLVSFYLEVAQQAPMAQGIANTAHLSGAAFGAILGRLSFFSLKA